jgi:hypothetical protein
MSEILENGDYDSSDSSEISWDEEVEQNDDNDDESSDIPLLQIKWNHNLSFQSPEEFTNLARP